MGPFENGTCRKIFWADFGGDVTGRFGLGERGTAERPSGFVSKPKTMDGARMLGVFADFETNLRRARQLEGIAEAKAAVVYSGRAPSIEASWVRELKAQGMRLVDIANALKIGRGVQGAGASIDLTRKEMPKSTEEMLQTLEELIDEYSAFQRGRPDLPQGNLVDLSQDELEQIVDAFQQHKSQLDEQAGRSGPQRLH
jgi:hypothetical protein